MGGPAAIPLAATMAIGAGLGTEEGRGILFGEEKELQREPRMTPGQMQLLEGLTGLLGKQLGQGVEPYPGQRVAGKSPLQSMLFQLTQRAAEPTAELGMEYLQPQQWQPEAAQKYWETTFKAPALETWREDVVPEIQESYAGRNALDSGAFNRALAESGRRLTTGLSGQLADILYSGRQAHLGRQLERSGLGLNILDQMLARLGGIGGTQRGIEQQQLGGQYQQWLGQQPYQNPWLQQMPTALGVSSPYQFTTTGGGGGLLGGMAPGLGQSLPMAAMMAM